MDHYFNLGPYHRPITARSAFHREEALRCFANVTEPQLAAQAMADVPATAFCFCRQPDSRCDLDG